MPNTHKAKSDKQSHIFYLGHFIELFASRFPNNMHIRLTILKFSNIQSILQFVSLVASTENFRIVTD
jgi:hypothetical protein